MTDKQIIIDGVDVSECTRYCADNGKCTAFKSQYLCSERNNCYTKRILKKNKTINILKEKLLRKEQECEAYKMEAEEGKEINAELKAELTRANCQIADNEILQCDMREAIEELKAENKILKEKFEIAIKNNMDKTLLRLENGDVKEELKAKEQECEELKIYIESNEQQVKEVEKLVMDNDRLINELDQLKAENDELKKKCNIYTCGICGNKEDCNKLYKTLTEIKEIAEICKCHNADGCYECKYFDDCEVEDEEIPTRDICKLILQKISECEVE